MKRAAMLCPIVVAVTSASATAQNPGFQDPAAIDRAVSAFVAGATGMENARARPVDRRLRLAACRSPLALAWHGGARGTILVQCPEPGGWRLFVPAPGAGERTGQHGAPVVNRGDPVSIRIAGRGFAVTTTGEALEAGQVDQWIRIRPIGAKASLRGQVVGAGLVAVVQS